MARFPETIGKADRLPPDHGVVGSSWYSASSRGMTSAARVESPDKRPHDALMVHVALEEVIERVAAKTSTMSQMTAGAGQTAIDLSQLADVAELKKLLGKKSKKRKATGPIWERGWFLASCLAVMKPFWSLSSVLKS